MTDDPGRLPDFIVVGAMKAGTTSLLHNLARHAEVRMPKREVHFFDRFYDRGLGWYRSQFIRGEGKVCGEKTPSYMTKRETMERIHHVVPDAKIIILLREPVARVLSQINHRIVKGKLPQPERIDLAYLRAHILDGGDRERDYLGRSDYITQIEDNILPFFDRERLFVRATDGFAATADLSRLADASEGDDAKRGGHAPNPFQRELMHELQDFLGIGRRTRHAYKAVGVRGYRADVEPDVRAFLADRFIEPNERLFTFLGYRIPAWSRAVAVGG